jgi:predicted tellurium resistance membrane protein TerC
LFEGLRNVVLGRGFGALLAVLFLGMVGAYGVAIGGGYHRFVAANGAPADILAKAMGFGVDVITISGQRSLSADEALAAAAVTDRHSLLFLDALAVRERLMATPLLAVLLIVEVSDLVFAVDSIPAVFGITQDPFLVFSSNIMAIIGLRALYFAVASLLGAFRFLKTGLAILIAVIGVKLILQPMGYHAPPLVTLSVIAAILGGSIGLSLLFPGPAQALGAGAETKNEPTQD